MKNYPVKDEVNEFGVTVLWSQLYRDHEAMVPVVCRCGNSRTLTAYNLLHTKGKGLCISCGKKVLSSGNNHFRWKGGLSLNHSGYQTIRPSALSESDRLLAEPMLSRNGTVRLHRLIMARHIGRPLTPQEHVHHIDGNKLNNDIDNLQLLSNSSHQSTGHGQIKELLAEVTRLRALLRRFKIPF